MALTIVQQVDEGLSKKIPSSSTGLPVILR